MKSTPQRLLAFSIAVAWPLVASARYRRSYDAWTHMFFADHYRRAWWTLWEPRWYGGFPVVAYPPLVHQIIALLSFPFGVEAAWALVMLVTLTALPFAFRAFARRFVGPRIADRAAFLVPLLPSIHLTAHTFGQLPTLFGLAAMLAGLAALADFLQDGDPRHGAQAALWITTAAAAHHGTLLMVPWAVAAIGLWSLTAHPASALHMLRRLFLWAMGTAAGVGAVIWPFWSWGLSQTMQRPIDHASRHSFLQDPTAAEMFLWPMYGPLLLALPFVIPCFRHRRRWAMGGLFAFCFVMGLGGTTPLPRWIYGTGWEWLTYDRFALWATLWLTPVLGGWALALQRRFRWMRWAGCLSLLLMGAAALYASQFASLRPTQPPLLDLSPLVDFLDRGEVQHWRYVTFGFGDQMARLSLYTRAETIDGNYHTARPWPVLRESGLGSLDTAYWLPDGLKRLERVMDGLGEVGVRWAFVYHPAYTPLLARHGWRLRQELANGVEIWENPSATPPPPSQAEPFHPLAALSWGLLPGLSWIAAIVLSLLPRANLSASRMAQKPPR